MARSYRMRKRAEDRDRTRERIIRATMRVHDEKGVAPATFTDIAKRAGVGVATVTRHFPTLGDLVRACGGHVWAEMRPPVPEAAPALFAGAQSTRERLERLVRELDAFYERGALRLALASRDRELVPELDQFLCAVEAGVAAMVNEALRGADATQPAVAAVNGLMSFPVWAAFNRLGLSADELARMRTNLVECALKSVD